VHNDQKASLTVCQRQVDTVMWIGSLWLVSTLLCRGMGRLSWPEPFD